MIDMNAILKRGADDAHDVLVRHQTRQRIYGADLQTLFAHMPQTLSSENADLDVNALTAHSVDIFLVGTKGDLLAVVKVLRRFGYQPDDRPAEGDTEWATRWRKDQRPELYLSFTSTQCERVATGTEMVEQTTYKTVCGEPVGGNDLLAELG